MQIRMVGLYWSLVSVVERGRQTLRGERGATMLEYALLGLTIVVGVSAVAILLRNQIRAVLNQIITALTGTP